MHAIFNNENAAIEFEAKIHAYLCAKRPGYKEQTKKWSDIIKHQNQDLWAVALPPEKIDGVYETVSNLDGWMLEEFFIAG